MNINYPAELRGFGNRLANWLRGAGMPANFRLSLVGNELEIQYFDPLDPKALPSPEWSEAMLAAIENCHNDWPPAVDFLQEIQTYISVMTLMMDTLDSIPCECPACKADMN